MTPNIPRAARAVAAASRRLAYRPLVSDEATAEEALEALREAFAALAPDPMIAMLPGAAPAESLPPVGWINHAVRLLDRIVSTADDPAGVTNRAHLALTYLGQARLLLTGPDADAVPTAGDETDHEATPTVDVLPLPGDRFMLVLSNWPQDPATTVHREEFKQATGAAGVLVVPWPVHLTHGHRT